jgi:hypothetical protein
MYKNLSLDAHTATVVRPDTIPAVYSAARVISGPPSMQTGAITAPKIAACAAQASCFDPRPGEYTEKQEN